MLEIAPESNESEFIVNINGYAEFIIPVNFLYGLAGYVDLKFPDHNIDWFQTFYKVEQERFEYFSLKEVIKDLSIKITALEILNRVLHGADGTNELTEIVEKRIKEFKLKH